MMRKKIGRTATSALTFTTLSQKHSLTPSALSVVLLFKPKAHYNHADGQ